MDVGESHIPTAEAERQSFVIESQLMKDCGVNVVNIEPILHGAHPHFVRFAESHAALESASRHPNRVAAHVVIAAIGP